MTKPVFTVKRNVGVALLITTLLCIANELFAWGVFGRFGRPVTAFAVFILLVYIFRVGPTPDEVVENRRLRGLTTQPRLWVHVLVIALAMLLVFVISGSASVLARGENLERTYWIKLLVTQALVIATGIVSWFYQKRRRGE